MHFVGLSIFGCSRVCHLAGISLGEKQFCLLFKLNSEADVPRCKRTHAYATVKSSEGGKGRLFCPASFSIDLKQNQPYQKTSRGPRGKIKKYTLHCSNYYLRVTWLRDNRQARLHWSTKNRKKHWQFHVDNVLVLRQKICAWPKLTLRTWTGLSRAHEELT